MTKPYCSFKVLCGSKTVFEEGLIGYRVSGVTSSCCVLVYMGVNLNEGPSCGHHLGGDLCPHLGGGL